MTLRNLFQSVDYADLMNKNRECDFSDIWTDYVAKTKRGELMKDLVNKMLSKDPKKRPSAAQALEHRLFKKEIEPVRNSLRLNKFLAQDCRISLPRIRLEVS